MYTKLQAYIHKLASNSFSDLVYLISKPYADLKQ